MKKAISGILLGLILGTAIDVLAQGSLSNQVLRLLTRDNTWSGTQTFGTVPVVISTISTPPLTATNKLYNVGGTLYWNGSALGVVSGAGTVTSVDMSVPAFMSVSGGPITASGTFIVDFTSQTINKVLASGSSGGSATPAFRALVDADIPNTITIDGSGNVSWDSVSKAGASLADLTTKSASDLTSGTLPDARFPSTLPALSGVNLTALNASNLASGTVACGRLPAHTGDITSSAGSCATTLANTAVTPASYTYSSITVDSKGRITAASSGTAPTGGTVTHVPSALTANNIIIGNGSADVTILGSLGTTTTLLHGNAAGAPTFGAVSLTADVSGILPKANGGTGISTSAVTNGQLLIGNTTGPAFVLAGLTGTSNQVVVTNGAGTITLSLPQSIATSSTPQFARLGLGAAAGASALITGAGQLNFGFVDDGNSSTADTIDWNGGEDHKSTMTGSATYTFSNPIAGRTYTLLLIQGGAGSYVATWPGTVKWTAGSAPTLTTTVGKIDWCRFFYDGTSYLGSCALNY